MKNKNNPPRVAAIHDLSCFGRCALTVVIPVLSAMGCQVIPIPTALLSTHTGGYDNIYFRDLSDDMRGIITHFRELGVGFDAIYSGFLGSAGQIDIVSDFIGEFGEGIPVLVDPVMGDDGILYKTYTDKMVSGMGRLCRSAGIITPNLTEATILTGIKMPPEHFPGEDEAGDFAARLVSVLRGEFGDKRIVITGIHFGDRIANAYADIGEPCRLVFAPRLPLSFPGTGEVFASVLLGGILGGQSLEDAVRRAEKFTFYVIKSSQASGKPQREGVMLEGSLGELVR